MFLRRLTTDQERTTDPLGILIFKTSFWLDPHQGGTGMHEVAGAKEYLDDDVTRLRQFHQLLVIVCLHVAAAIIRHLVAIYEAAGWLPLLFALLRCTARAEAIDCRFEITGDSGYDFAGLDRRRHVMEEQEGPPEKGPRVYRLVVTDGAGRELERQRVELAPGSPLDLPSCAVGAPLVWRFQALRLGYDEEDLPRLAIMLKGERSAHHAMPQLVGPRHDTLFEVRAFGSDYGGHDLQIGIREIPGETGLDRCVAMP